GENQRSDSMDQEEVLRASDTGVGLKRNSAQQGERLSPPMTPELKPHHLTEQACSDGERGENDQTRLSIACDGSRGQQQRNGRNGNADLLCEDGQEQHELDMMEEKVQRLLHTVIRLRDGAPRSMNVDA